MSSQNSSDDIANLTIENYTGTKILDEFEKKFKFIFPQLTQELNRQVKQFINKFLSVSFKQKNPNEILHNSSKQSEIVQDFYQKIHKYILTSASIKSYLDRLNVDNKAECEQDSLSLQNDNGDKIFEAIMILIEHNVNDSIYDYVFPAIMREFEEQDMKLQKRIRDFYWITNEMIGTCIDENNVIYKETYEEALNCNINRMFI